MKRRQFLRTSATATTALAAGSMIFSKGVHAQNTKQPNILFFFSDDHAQQAISAYGSKINETPGIDRIAKEGAIFMNNFCTNSICAPSRAVVITGKHSHLNGVLTNRRQDEFDGSQQTFPKLLQAAGYQTAMIGKWHLKSSPTGFDYWEVLPGQGSYYNPDFKTQEGVKRYTGHSSEIIANKALTWLKEKKSDDKPFLLHCWFKAPHRAWMPSPKHLTKYDDQDIWEPPTLFDDYEGRTSSAAEHAMGIDKHMRMEYDLKVTAPLQGGKVRGSFSRLNEEQRKQWDAAYIPKNEAFKKANLSGKELVRWKYQRYIKDYLRCIAGVDDQIVRILKYLDDTGLADNTIVIYSSDQGFYLGEHGWYDKRWMYEESLRMPLVMRWPGKIKPGTKVNALTQNIDYAPTFLSAVGAPVPADLQGKNMLPLLEGKSDDWRKSIYYHYYEFPDAHHVQQHYGVRTDRYKLIHFYNKDEWELFDLKNDPMEMKSEYDNPEYAGIIKNLKTEIKKLREQYKDTGELTNQNSVKGLKKHSDFDDLRFIKSIKKIRGGWQIQATENEAAHALQKLKNPARNTLTIKANIHSPKQDGVRNGMVAFGPTTNPQDILRAGVYIGAGEIVILDAMEGKIASMTLPNKDKDKVFDVEVQVDLKKKELTLLVDGSKVTAPLKNNWTKISYAGFGLNRTMTNFMDYSISAK